jgi:trans-aconitate methyltransferase
MDGGHVSTSSRDDWDRHWDDYSQCAQDNPALDYRRRVIFSMLAMNGAGAGVRLLDIGSGQGDMAAAVLAKFPSAEVLGLELSHSGVEISSKKVPGARFVQRNLLEQIAAPPDQLNWATHAVCSEVIEHVDDPVQLLRSAREYMRPDCLLVVTAPGGPMSSFDKHIGHRKHYRPEEIETLFREAGYVPVRASRAGFPFFNLYRSLVVLRGEKIIDDAVARDGKAASLPARMAMAAFSPLFHLNLDSSPWGWQMTGIARASVATELPSANFVPSDGPRKGPQ